MNELLERLREQSFHGGIPMTGQFELTPGCNFNCEMCYLDKPAGQKNSVLPASFWLETARQARELGLLVLSVTGGEPFLYPHLREVMEGLLSMGFLLSFNTNGSRIDESALRWFRTHPIAKINISLYGASDETYRKLCRSPEGTFHRVLAGIDGLLAMGQNVFLTAVLTPENEGELWQMRALAEERGLTLHTAEYLYPPAGPDYRRLPAERVAELAASHLSDADRASARVKIALRDRMPCGFPACTGGKSSFTITYDGRLVPCVMMRHLEAPMDRGFAAGWEELRRRMEAVRVPERCENCRHAGVTCPACKGALHMEAERGAGDIGYLCSIARESAERIGEGEWNENIVLSDCRGNDWYPCGI